MYTILGIKEDGQHAILCNARAKKDVADVLWWLRRQGCNEAYMVTDKTNCMARANMRAKQVVFAIVNDPTIQATMLRHMKLQAAA